MPIPEFIIIERNNACTGDDRKAELELFALDILLQIAEKEELDEMQLALQSESQLSTESNTPSSRTKDGFKTPPKAP